MTAQDRTHAHEADEGAQALEHLARSINDLTRERHRGSVRDYLERLEQLAENEAPPLKPAD